MPSNGVLFSPSMLTTQRQTWPRIPQMSPGGMKGVSTRTGLLEGHAHHHSLRTRPWAQQTAFLLPLGMRRQGVTSRLY